MNEAESPPQKARGPAEGSVPQVHRGMWPELGSPDEHLFQRVGGGRLLSDPRDNPRCIHIYVYSLNTKILDFLKC